MKITAGARQSPLSIAQVQEVQKEIQTFFPALEFMPCFIETQGDKDQKTSLRTLGKTDFFTKELDEMLLRGEIRVAIHSAKDLPEPLLEGLSLIALTQGVDARDSLVLKKGQTLDGLPSGAKIATSASRREEAVKKLRSDVEFVDVRGKIGERLALLEKGEVEGVVIAEAALIRLQLTDLNRVFLPGEAAPLQGKLAVLARTEDREIGQIFSLIDSRSSKRKVLYLGLDPTNWKKEDSIFHYPVISTSFIDSPELKKALRAFATFTHVIFTSKTAVRYFCELIQDFKNKSVIALGEGTYNELKIRGIYPILAKEPTQEGVIETLKTFNLKKSHLFWPRSKRSRPLLEEFLQKSGAAYTVVDLYEPISQKLEPVPSLAPFSEIVFTSPSTVEAFQKIFPHLPPHIQLTPIGPITAKKIGAFSLGKKTSPQIS